MTNAMTIITEPVRHDLAAREARSWITRQLRWERTLDTLRHEKVEQRQAA